MTVTTATNIGKREEQQDALGVSEGEGSLYAVIADGHGSEGGEIARGVVEDIISNSLKEPLSESIPELFKNLAAQYFQGDSGTTVAFVAYEKGKFHFAQLGDSSITWIFQGKVYHWAGHNVSNPDNPDIEKLEEAGVTIYGRYQICPQGRRMLQLTRSIGDLCFGAQVSKVPDILEVEADAVVICSDGFTGDIQEVKKLLDARANAAMFIKNQETRGIKDNISVIAIYV